MDKRRHLFPAGTTTACAYRIGRWRVVLVETVWAATPPTYRESPAFYLPTSTETVDSAVVAAAAAAAAACSRSVTN